MTVEIRSPTVDEAPAIRALIDEHALAAFGAPELSEEEIRDWFTQQNLEFRVAERDGYLDIQLQESGRFPADIRTLDAAAAARLLDEAERIGRERGATVVRSFVQGDDPVLRPVLEDAGWKLVPDADRPRPRAAGAGMAERACASQRASRGGEAGLRGAPGRVRGPLGAPPLLVRGLAELQRREAPLRTFAVVARGRR